MAQPIVVNDATVGYLVTGTGVSPAPAEGVVARVNRATWLAALAGGAAALVLGGAIAFGLLKPVRELTEAAEGLAVGELSRRVRVRTTDELGELSLSFNQMAEALERAEVTRQDMTADIAHELRTPLAIIQARLEAVMDGVHDPSRETLEPILQQTRTLNRLIDDLRTLALADAGELALEDTQVDLRAFLEREVNAFSRQAEGAGVDLHLELPADLSLNAVLDPVRMRQVLANLITNAIRHTRRGGEVWVSLLHPTPAAFRIIVQDNGEGIPAESAERVFERFYRADRGRAREKGGTGLGLAIARKLVQAHAGSLWAESPPEGGARFVLEIPLKGQREGDHSAG
jgi:signal transduction histidine kinase